MVPRRQPLRLKDEALELLGERALHWPRLGLLAVADLHWGKTESFHQHGIALPEGVLETDLARLDEALATTGATRLLLVGDLVHSARAMTREVVERISRWRRGHEHLHVTLIRGNHERHVKALPDAWRMDVAEEYVDEGPFRFAHHPEPVEGRYVWAGHLHPVVTLRSGVEHLRLPCFHVASRVATLPAFSAFTGGMPVSRRPGERVFAVVEDRVLEV